MFQENTGPKSFDDEFSMLLMIEEKKKIEVILMRVILNINGIHSWGLSNWIQKQPILLSITSLLKRIWTTANFLLE